MAKRKENNHRTVGLEPNNLCLHCGQKVRKVTRLETGYFVEHWWSKVICKNMSGAGEIIEEFIEAQLKKHKYIVKGVTNESA